MANFNLNRVILGGRLTSDVELRTTPNGVSVCSFTIAVNRRFQSRDSRFHQLRRMASAGGVHHEVFSQRQLDLRRGRYSDPLVDRQQQPEALRDRRSR